MLLALLLAMQASPPSEIRIRSSDRRSLDYQSTIINGKTKDGKPVQLRLERIARSSVFSIRLKGFARKEMSARLDAGKYPLFDVYSARPTYVGNYFFVTIKYGAAKPCYDGDDGRDEVRITFVPGVTKLETSANSCHL